MFVVVIVAKFCVLTKVKRCKLKVPDSLDGDGGQPMRPISPHITLTFFRHSRFLSSGVGLLTAELGGGSATRHCSE